jgi:tRNA U34 5-methylaminomethyl-2-thiouridine-forming methyltransferase MnmC
LVFASVFEEIVIQILTLQTPNTFLYAIYSLFIMETIITDDGSITFRHPEHLEPYHTKSGAVVEAMEKHARALHVWEKNNPVIFDICSGLSYSAACALEEIRRHGNESFVTIYLFENDRVILEKNLELSQLTYIQDGIPKEISCYFHFRNAIKKYLEAGVQIYTSTNLRIVIIFGDFRNNIDTISVHADYIFYAPFSPQISKELWTPDVFKKLFDKLNSGGKLSTYSYARSVRDALSEVGFKIEKGPVLGRRSPSLIAKK